MPKIICKEFDEFERAMLRINGRLTPIKSRTRDWCHHSVDLGDVTVSINQVGSGVIYRGAMQRGFYALFCPLTHAGSCRIYGRDMEPGLTAWFVPEIETYSYGREAFLWLGITLEKKHVAQWVAEQTEQFLPSLRANRVYVGNKKVLDALIELVKRALHADVTNPLAFQSTRCKETLKRQVLDATYFATLSDGSNVERSYGRPRLSRRSIVQNAMSFIDANLGDGVSLRDLCLACSVSPRTLHSVFLEEIGVSPHRYLTLKRLSAIHKALMRGHAEETVASICAKHGVWDFGRFANLYRRVFGVLPSQVLRGH
ncbi:helix-turn-helix domain-containing protein [Dyella japonica]|uniref:HTH araC/xylS-type domain-containing protein n=1 Tax=Dyella japonica A8 TaxID=1217721 RepID=A0A075JX55_9GAMM|nr:helix-turn-helix domain-containing protein [Dyella japonica]AIF46115.1 hypothetical protein HY57_02020 [Dyella japonica A8]